MIEFKDKAVNAKYVELRTRENELLDEAEEIQDQIQELLDTYERE